MRTTSILAALVLTLSLSATNVQGAPLVTAVQCVITNQTPTVSVGQQASYVVDLSGGYGSYSIWFDYGDGLHEQRSVTDTSAIFLHTFAAPGLYTQSATVTGAGSQDICSTSTDVQ